MDKCLQFNDSVLCPPFISFIRANNFPPPQVQCGDTDPLTCQRDERQRPERRCIRVREGPKINGVLTPRLIESGYSPTNKDTMQPVDLFMGVMRELLIED
jgi:hypothetical protein